MGHIFVKSWVEKKSLHEVKFLPRKVYATFYCSLLLITSACMLFHLLRLRSTVNQSKKCFPGWGPRRKQVCPDRPRRKVPMSRPSQMEVAYVQIFVRSPDFRAFMSRLSCVHQTFVRSPDFRAFNQFLCVHVQTFVRSPNFRAFNQFSCVHVQTFER